VWVRAAAAASLSRPAGEPFLEESGAAHSLGELRAAAAAIDQALGQ